ncbi:hypothetical protein MASR2M15_05120 [Anaerolineales bacterium]
MNRPIVRQITVIITFIITLALNAMANILPLNGQTSAEVANRLPIYFVPANYVFSIWGIIYLLLIGFVVFHSLPSQKDNPRLEKISYLFALSGIANAVWLIFFHYEQFPLTMIAMVILLGLLISIYLRLGIGKAAVSLKEKLLVHLPFSVYLGWITVATIANASYVLYDMKWDGLGIDGSIWAFIMILIAGLVTLLMLAINHDIAYSAVIVWALVGIYIKQSETPLVANSAAIVSVVIIAAAIISFIRMRQIQNKPNLIAQT